MRKMLSIGVLALFGCAEAPTTPDASIPPNLATTTLTTSVSIPVSIPVFIPCANGGAGESVLMEGDLHILTSLTVNGNLVRLKSHFQPQGLTGIGTVTGDKYQGTGVTQSEDVAHPPFPIEFTFVNNFRMIGQGPGNNFLVHENMHVTVNANGDVTATHDNLSTECK